MGVSGREYNVVIRPRRGGAPDRKRLWFALVFAPVAVLGIARSFHHSVTSGLWYAAGALTLTAFTVMARANFFARTSIAVSASFVRRTGYVGRSAGWTRGRSSCASGTRSVSTGMSRRRFEPSPSFGARSQARSLGRSRTSGSRSRSWRS
jgi:hypothetical protein